MFPLDLVFTTFLCVYETSNFLRITTCACFLPSALCLCLTVSQHNLDIKSFPRYKYNLGRVLDELGSI